MPIQSTLGTEDKKYCSMNEPSMLAAYCTDVLSIELITIWFWRIIKLMSCALDTRKIKIY